LKHEASELTVIVPTWNRRDLLRGCLEALKRQTAPVQILVVDDGSTDDTASLVREAYPQVTLLSLERNLGFAAAANRGLSRVTTPFAALLNNDAEPEARWAEAGLRALREAPPNFGFFASRILQAEHPDLLDGAGDLYSRTGLPTKRGWGKAAGRYPAAEEVMGASAGAAFYRMEMLRHIGFFDEDFVMYLEDVELSLRARLYGYRCGYLPDAVVLHREAASDPQRTGSGAGGTPRAFYSDRRVYWITRNRWLLMVMYQPWRHLPWLFLGWTRSLLFHSVKAGHTGAFLRGIAAGWAATPVAVRKRRRFIRDFPEAFSELWQVMTPYWPSA
jgi:GT2 family glycosyltransferase